MRVLVVTVVHVPEDARIRHRQIASLLDAGHEVTYVAPFTGAAQSYTDGLHEIAVPRAVGRRRGAALVAARRELRRLGPAHDLVVLHDPELLVAAAGLGLPPVVWDVHEDLALSLADKPWLPAGLRRPIAGVVGAMEDLAESRVHVLLAEHAYQDRFDRLHPVAPNLPVLPATTRPAASRREVVHLGRVSRLRGVGELLAVGEALRDRDLSLHLIGPVDVDVRDRVEAAHAAGAVVAHGFVPNDQAIRMIAGAVAGLSLLHDHPNYRVALPTKIVEYHGAGIPTVTTPLPEAVRVLRTSGAGEVVPFGDVDRTVVTVTRWADQPELARHLGRRARDAAASRWSWQAHAPVFVGQLEQWAAGP